jgi:phage head maturation protease
VILAKIKAKIQAAMKRIGADVADQKADTASARAESQSPYFRSFPLEDISIRAGGDGRTVDAYAAVFGDAAEVKDQDGHYLEELDPAVFNRAISHAAPQGSRAGWRVGVFYNHGMTLYGTPSEKHAMPVGVPLEIKADSKGLFTRTRYHKGEFCDEILERIREGSIPGYSFSGVFRRSNPLIPRGGFRPNYRTAELPKVRRTESTLEEYGPTPRPIYEGASVTAMRADPMMLGAMFSDPQIAQRMREMFSGSAPEDSLPDPGAPILGPATGDSHPLVRSGRSVKEEMQAARSAFLQRYRR